MASGRTILGVALGERSIQVAQVSPRGQTRVAELALAPGAWEQPAAVGQSLLALLRKEQMTARRAVVGVPARWLMARAKELPPSSAAVAAATLRLQAERDFGAEAKDLVLDYAGDVESSEARRVLLVAMPAARMEHIRSAMQAAGISFERLTSTSLALAAAVGEGHGSGWLLAVTGEGAELVGVGREAMLLRPLAGSPAGHEGNGEAAARRAGLAAELRRAVAVGSPGRSPEGPTLVWDGSSSLDPAGLAELSERTGMALRPAWGDGKWAGAVALARHPAGPEGGLHLLHSKLAVRPASRWGRRTTRWAVAAGAGVALLAGVWFDAQRRQAGLDRLQQQLKQIDPQVRSAQVLSEQLAIARGWQDGRPSAVDALKEITQAFPAEGTIWASTLTLSESGAGRLTGRAVDDRSVLATLGRLKASAMLADVKLHELRQAGGSPAGGTGREVMFTLSFVVRPPGAAKAPAAGGGS